MTSSLTMTPISTRSSKPTMTSMSTRSSTPTMTSLPSMTSSPSMSSISTLGDDKSATKINKAALGIPEYSTNEEGASDLWKNNADDIFKDKANEDVFRELQKKQFQDAMSGGSNVLNGLGLRVKMAASSATHHLPQDGAACSPRVAGASGFAKVVCSPRFPPHDLFKVSRMLRVRLRHSNLSFSDDTMLDGRIACLKFSDVDSGGPLDLILHTGRIPQYYNAESFRTFVAAFKKGGEELKNWCFKQPINYRGRVESVRRAPKSFYDQRYYSHVTYELTSTDGVRNLCRFRLLPADGSDETGLPDKADQEEIWKVARLGAEVRHSGYLALEYQLRLSKRPLQYRLQIQTRDPDDMEQSDPDSDISLGDYTIDGRGSVSSQGDLDAVRARSRTFSDAGSICNGRAMSFASEAASVARGRQAKSAVVIDDMRSVASLNDCNNKHAKRSLNNGQMNSNQNVNCGDDSGKEPQDGDPSRDLLNACKPWDTKRHPWHDVAIVTLTTQLSEDVLTETKFSLANHSDGCRPAASRSANDFGSLAGAVRELNGFVGIVKVVPSEGIDLDQNRYRIVVRTGNLIGAGTDGDVFVSLTGSTGKTRAISLDQRFRDDFEEGQTDVFEERGSYVGQLVSVDVTLSSVLPKRKWFLDDIVVTDLGTGKTARFPCYQWMTSQRPSVSLPRAEATIPHLEPMPLRYLQRKFELSERCRMYQWRDVDGLPGRMRASRYEDLPKEVQFQTEKERDLLAKYMRTLANTGSGNLTTLFGTWDTIQDNPKLLTVFLKDKGRLRQVIKEWDTDEEFGRQILNGPHPIRIQRARQLPDVFESSRSEIQAQLDRPGGLDSNLEDGTVFVLEYPELRKLDQSRDYRGKYKRHLSTPTCLLHVTTTGKLQPIAISLSGDVTGPVWTPADPAAEWTLAKMWVRAADAQIHHVVSRHLNTHLVMEAVAMATMRNLPSAHPLYKLLLPHLRYTIAVNALGRQSLYPAEDGLFDKYLAVGGQHEPLMRAAYSRFNIRQLDLPANLAERGVECPMVLPGYYYRDDALSLWRVIQKFVRTVIYLHYWSDGNVAADEELQAWMDDLAHNGLPPGDQQSATDANRRHGLPEGLRILDDVIRLVTIIVFTASAQHAALTSGIVDYYGYVPNAPTMLLAPPPGSKGGITAADIQGALPSRGKTAEIIAACYTISRYDNDEVYLGECPEPLFDDEATLGAVFAFQEDLKQLSSAIQERNSSLEHPYTYLIPEHIPKSVSM